MFYILNLSDIGDAVAQALRTLMGHILALLYRLIENLYTVFIYLSQAEILDSEFIQSIYSKVGMILGIFMIFKLTFSLIQALIDPDKLTDKQKGYTAILTRTIIAIVLLGLTPAIFREAFNLQREIVGSENGNNIIYKLIASKTANGNFTDMGRVLASDMYFSFFTDNEEPILDRGSIDEMDENKSTGTYYDRIIDDTYEHLVERIRNKENNSSFHDTVEYLTVKEANRYIIEFDWFLSLCAAVFIIWMFMTYCIQVGIRVVQLAYLQLIAPIPVLSYISDPDGTFKRWVKQCTTTYLDLFIRLAIIYFVMTLIGDVIEQFRKAGSVIITSTGLDINKDSGTLAIIKVFIIMGLLLFAKKVPELLKDLFPNLGGGAASLSFGLGPKKVLEQFKNLPLVSSGAKAIGYMGKKAIGYADRKIHHAPRPRGKIGQFVDKLAPERAKVIAANRQAKIDDKLRTSREKHGKELFENYGTNLENAFRGHGSKEYTESYNRVKSTKKQMKAAENLLNDIDKELNAAYAMDTGMRSDGTIDSVKKKRRDDAIDLANKRREAAAKNYAAYKADHERAVEKHDNMKKMSKYQKFAEIEDDYKYYTDRHPALVNIPSSQYQSAPQPTSQSAPQPTSQSAPQPESQPTPQPEPASSKVPQIDDYARKSQKVTAEESVFGSMSDSEFKERQAENNRDVYATETDPNEYFDKMNQIYADEYLENDGVSDNFEKSWMAQTRAMEDSYKKAGWKKDANGKWTKDN